MRATGWSRHQLVLIFVLVLLFSGQLFAGVTASISGTVKDASGATVAGATVIATNTETGISQKETTNAQGYYSFPYLPVGTYDVSIQQTGFRAFHNTGIVLLVNDAAVVDASLQVGVAA